MAIIAKIVSGPYRSKKSAYALLLLPPALTSNVLKSLYRAVDNTVLPSSKVVTLAIFIGNAEKLPKTPRITVNHLANLSESVINCCWSAGSSRL